MCVQHEHENDPPSHTHTHTHTHTSQIAGTHVKNVAVWGNHSSTVVPDIRNAFVVGTGGVVGAQEAEVVAEDDEEAEGAQEDGGVRDGAHTGAEGLRFQSPALAAIGDDEWVKSELAERLRNRSKEVVERRRLTPALSAARAISMHIRDLNTGTKEGEFVSMGVYCDHDKDPNPFEIAGGIFFSVPVTISHGKWAFAAVSLDVRCAV
jgi:malate/lactate dehydrogenase